MSEDMRASFNALPAEMLINIFKYLSLNDVSRLGRVCKKWYHCSRSNLLWEKVDVKLLFADKIPKLFAVLPSCVTHLRVKCDLHEKPLYLPGLSVTLRERCPNLQVLVLGENVEGRPLNGSELRYLLRNFPASLRVLTLKYFTRVSFPELLFNVLTPIVTSQIEVLDVHCCDELRRDGLALACMLPQLKVLRTSVSDRSRQYLERYSNAIRKLHVLDLEFNFLTSESFQCIWRFGDHLTELYLCGTDLQDRHLTFDVGCVPQLSVICIRHNSVTHQGIKDLSMSCPSLTRIFASVCSCEDSRTVHGKFNNVVCGKVHCEYVIDEYALCKHWKSIDYMA